ncbi:type VII toxin-antitoxin system MntA family adenylyltransferase antitoxin [Chloroflexus sp.]|uniref:type VII toxin-antitoxin system MntA family adenylyltransferase antitoxin n=1 Tax=Chloroflexus sp. TaxID=1904827 RepID=UPI00404A0324
MSELGIQHLRQQDEAMMTTHPNVCLVYLFGSQVSGTTGPLSDVDLAVLLTHGTSMLQAMAKLELRFAVLLDGRRANLIVLNQAPIELAYAVIAQGTIIYQRSLAERVEYEAEVMSRYGDYLPFLRAQQQDILQGTGNERRVQRYRAALERTLRTIGTSDATPYSNED